MGRLLTQRDDGNEYLTMADPANLEETRALFQAQRTALIKKYRAEGAGIGRSQSGQYEIVIYLAKPNDIPAQPVILDGVPIRFEVTGKFNLQRNP